PGRAAPRAAVLALLRQPALHADRQHSLRHQPLGHGHVLQGLPPRCAGRRAAALGALRHRGRAHGQVLQAQAAHLRGADLLQRPPWLRHGLRTVLHLALDGLAVAASFYLAYLTRFRWVWWTRMFPIPGRAVPEWHLYARLLYVFVPLWLGLFWYSCRLYDRPW